MRVRAPPWQWQFFREIFDSLQFQDFVLIDKIPFYSAFLKAIVLLLRTWTVVNTKKKKYRWKVFGPAEIWTGRSQIQSQLCLPLDQSFMKIVKKGGKICDQGLKNSNFKHCVIATWENNFIKMSKSFEFKLSLNFYSGSFIFLEMRTKRMEGWLVRSHCHVD